MMKFFRKCLYLMMAIILSAGAALVVNPVTVNAASLNRTSASVYPGDSFKLKISGKNAVWRTSDTSVATVSQKGVVKAKKAGKCTISVKVGLKKYKCKVTVKKLTVNNVKKAWKKYWKNYVANSGGAYCYSSYVKSTKYYVYYSVHAYTGFDFTVRIVLKTGRMEGRFASGYDPIGNEAEWEYWDYISHWM